MRVAYVRSVLGQFGDISDTPIKGGTYVKSFVKIGWRTFEWTQHGHDAVTVTSHSGMERSQPIYSLTGKVGGLLRGIDTHISYDDVDNEVYHQVRFELRLQGRSTRPSLYVASQRGTSWGNAMYGSEEEPDRVVRCQWFGIVACNPDSEPIDMALDMLRQRPGALAILLDWLKDNSETLAPEIDRICATGYNIFGWYKPVQCYKNLTMEVTRSPL